MWCIEEAKKSFPNACLVDEEEVNVFYVLAEEPEHYYAYASFG